MSQALPRRLRFAFLMQVAMASAVIVAGAYGALQIAKQDVAARTLRDEAAYYWQQRSIDPSRIPPDGAILHGYAIPVGASAAALPTSLRSLSPGLHNLPDLLVLMEQRDDVRLYLTYPQARIDRIALQLILAPVLLALLAVALSSWFTYRIARRMTAPLHWLAREVRRWDPRDPDVSALAPDKLPVDAGIETRQLAGALQRMGERMRLFVHRERDFTRDASHELRTPLTVIRVASDLMQSDPDLPERAHRSLARMQRAVRDMEAVIDAFLLLAREGEIEPQREDFRVVDVVDEEVEKARPLLAGKPVELIVNARTSPRLHASPRVLGVMLGNLLANACVFTERGRVEVTVSDDRIVVRDTGIGMSPETLQRAFDPFFRGDQANPAGRGMGLSIVRQLGERFHWPVQLESVLGQGTTATVRFAG
ncbi:MAG: sensor histidine kinase [Luteimonas sp.]